MIIASNFKTNYTRAKARVFIEAIQAFMRTSKTQQDVRIFTPATALDSFCEIDNLWVGAQNFYPTQNGSYTGEVGFEQLEEFSIKTVLIGHSERRHILGESQRFIAQKYAFALAKNVEIVYCIGEPKEIREQGIEAVMTYLWEQFEDIDTTYKNLVIAYEPVWAIGTGLSARREDIEEVLTRLSQRLKAPLLYGGSVNLETIKTILSISHCDGVLVGTASWDEEVFSKMIQIADDVTKG